MTQVKSRICRLLRGRTCSAGAVLAAALFLGVPASDAFGQSARADEPEESAGADADAPSFLDLDRPTIGLPIRLPFTEDVQDPLFAMLIGLVENDIYGTLNRSRLQAELDRRDAGTKLPYERLVDVTRLPADRDRPTNTIEVRFDDDVKLPVPYSILGYNPGSLRVSQTCRFLEWKLGKIEVPYMDGKGDDRHQKMARLEDVHLYSLVEGELLLDIDGWIDALMGGGLDDTDMVALMLCRYEGDWHGFAMGYNHDRKGRSGAMNFREDKIVFPSPTEVKTLGRKMRARAESLRENSTGVRGTVPQSGRP